MQGSIHRRIFVMGCSRSGTTLLQRMLANHSRIHTFPETGVFLKALGMRGWELPWTRLGLTLGKERKALDQLRARTDLPEAERPPLPPRRIRLERSVAETVDFLDRMALAHGRHNWVEKTPRHVLHASRIQKMVPDSLCIHVVRDGRDVVASIVDRAGRFPNRFQRQARAEYGIRQWNRSVQATQEALGREGHLVLIYEALVQAPEETLRAICQLLDLPFEPTMLESAEELSFIGDKEAWKSDVNAPIEKPPSKFPKVFDASSRDRIEKKLHLTTFQKFKEKAAERSPASLWAPWIDQ